MAVEPQIWNSLTKGMRLLSQAHEDRAVPEGLSYSDLIDYALYFSQLLLFEQLLILMLSYCFDLRII